MVTKHHPRIELQASRWTAAGAVGVFLAFVALLRERYRFLPPWARVSTLALIVSIAVVSTLPRARPATKAMANAATVSLVALLTAMLVVAIGSLIVQIYVEGAMVNGASVLSTTAVLWAANVIVFALWYWLIDRGDQTDAPVAFQGRSTCCFLSTRRASYSPRFGRPDSWTTYSSPSSPRLRLVPLTRCRLRPARSC